MIHFHSQLLHSFFVRISMEPLPLAIQTFTRRKCISRAGIWGHHSCLETRRTQRFSRQPADKGVEIPNYRFNLFNSEAFLNKTNDINKDIRIYPIAAFFKEVKKKKEPCWQAKIILWRKEKIAFYRE